MDNIQKSKIKVNQLVKKNNNNIQPKSRAPSPPPAHVTNKMLKFLHDLRASKLTFSTTS